MNDDLEYKFNYITNEYELVKKDWTLQNNYMTGQHEYAPPNSSPKYNFMENTYSMRNENNDQVIFNYMTNKYEVGADDWEVQTDFLNDDYKNR